MHCYFLTPLITPHKVSAHTGHNVTLVDTTNELLQKAEHRIKGSMERVAKKQFKDDSKARKI